MLLDGGIERTEFDIFIGSRIGSFKHIKYHTDQSQNSKKCIENLQEISTLQKGDTVTCMEWASDDQAEIFIGRSNQIIQTYDTVNGAFIKQVTADHGKGHVVGVCRVGRKLVTALSDGSIRVWGKKPLEFTAGGELDNIKCCQEQAGLIVTGGKENDLKVWQLGSPEPVFIAKNVRHDFLELRRPVWATDVTFLPHETFILASCSRYGTVRLYDTRAQRRPVCEVEFSNMAGTCISPGLGERQVLVGFGRGQLHNVDLRGKGHLDKGFKGSVGAVTAAQVVPGSQYVASIGLDRHIKVHHAHTKELLYKQYLTSKLSCLLVQTARTTPLTKVKAEVKDEEGENPDMDVATEVKSDLDEIFDDMETVSEKPKKRKKLEQKKKVKRKKNSVQGIEINEMKSESEENRDTMLDGAENKEENPDIAEDGIAKLLRSTEKKKRHLNKLKKKKKTKSLFLNA